MKRTVLLITVLIVLFTGCGKEQHTLPAATTGEQQSSSVVTDGDDIPGNGNNSDNVLSEYTAAVQERISSIKKSANYTTPEGVVYYISSSTGNDDNDGLSPETAWKTCNNINDLLGDLMWEKGESFEGATFLFKRGDTWNRDTISNIMANCIYSTYGEGEKTVFDMSYNFYDDAANPDYWTLADGYDDIWIYKEKVPFLGSITLNDTSSADNKDAFYWEDVWYANGGGEFSLNSLNDEQFFVDVHPGDEYKNEDGSQYYVYDCTDTGILYYRSSENPGTRYTSMQLCNGWGLQCGNNCTYDNLVVKNCGNQAFSNGNTENAIGCRMYSCEVYFCGDQPINMSYEQKTGFGGGETCGFHGEYSEYRDNYFYGSREGAGTCEVGWTGNLEEYDSTSGGNITYSGNVIYNCDGGFGIICYLDGSYDANIKISFENISISGNYFVNTGIAHDADGNDPVCLGSIFIWDHSHSVNMEGLKIENNTFINCGDETVINLSEYPYENLPDTFRNNTVVLEDSSGIHIAKKTDINWENTEFIDSQDELDSFFGEGAFILKKY